MAGIFRNITIEKAYTGYDDYRRSFRNAIRGYWSGQIDMLGFLDSLGNAIRRGFTRAWEDGSSAVGIAPNEITEDERYLLTGEINNEISRTLSFAYAIERGSKANGGKLDTFLKRAEMWTGRYQMIHSMAMVTAGRNKKLKWVMHPLKEHCGDCVRLNGRVYRASVWNKYGIRPRMRGLECGGWHCGCEFMVTNDPVTPGRPPSIVF